MDNSTSNQFFLFLSRSDHEGATSKLKASGFAYKVKMLESRVSNWEQILSILTEENLKGVLVKLTAYTYELMARAEYADAAKGLFAALEKVPHVIFVHETVITGVFDEDQTAEQNYRWGHIYFEPPDEAARIHTNELMAEYELNIIPYKKNAELTAIALTFIDENEKNLIFRVYVPEGRIWSTESEKVLHLFRDYLAKVSGLKVRQDQYKTSKGAVYEFFSDHMLDPTTLPAEFNEFSRLLDLCITEPQSAVRLLENKSVNNKLIYEIVERYAKEAKRLHIDLKQERERKVLSIRHRMESELIEIVPADADWGELNKILDSLVPTVDGVSSALGFGSSQTSHASNSKLTLNYKPQIIQRVQGIVAQEISGISGFGDEANEFLRLIQKYGGVRKNELISAIHEIESASLSSIS